MEIVCRYVNFGGHPWTKPFLLKVAKFMVPLPSLTNLILPIDGLARQEERDSIENNLD